MLWEITPEGKIIDVEFHKSIIHSIAALTYEQAQVLIDQPEENAKETKCGAVKRLSKIARIMRAKRIAAGALTLCWQLPGNELRMIAVWNGEIGTSKEM